jgi:CheY-like chemotaxis protein
VAITVTDTGCGMTPEVKERIFEPFFTTKEVGKGTGLGLAKVYGVIQQHGGTIHVYSEPGKGTTFRLYLPTAEAAAAIASAEERPAPALGTETILVAEDEPMVRNLAARILTEVGYTVLVASDGEEALRVFAENRWTIGLVLLDAVMPKLSGREVFRRIKAECPEVKILFCTGYDPESAHCRDIKEERARLLQKPFDASLLLRTVREVLDAEDECPLTQATC